MSSDRTRVYIAASLDLRTHVAEIAREHDDWMECTSRWALDSEWLERPEGDTHDEHFERMAQGDLEDLMRSDVALIIASRKGWGHAVEFGYALAKNIPVMVVGEEDGFFSTFHFLDEVERFVSTDEALDFIRAYRAHREDIRQLAHERGWS